MAMIAKLQAAPVITERLADNTIQAPASVAAGWSVWGSDGRIYPPSGSVCRIESWGGVARMRNADGTFTNLSTPTLIKIGSGEAVMPPSSGTSGGIAVQRID